MPGGVGLQVSRLQLQLTKTGPPERNERARPGGAGAAPSSRRPRRLRRRFIAICVRSDSTRPVYLNKKLLCNARRTHCAISLFGAAEHANRIGRAAIARRGRDSAARDGGLWPAVNRRR
ncbi:hypothetical protein EVAR_24011_1 [Eumeta japonica]|uniref:Uncharacterized protein n=1 Tax=Eumeta variegata TaxID=151549 RepID=A0A4C1W9Q1_EUMVA|nr:hypothetical protein EVAR_24011_1 [Eumeta japonica]